MGSGQQSGGRSAEWGQVSRVGSGQQSGGRSAEWGQVSRVGSGQQGGVRSAEWGQVSRVGAGQQGGVRVMAQGAAIVKRVGETRMSLKRALKSGSYYGMSIGTSAQRDHKMVMQFIYSPDP